MMDDDDEFGFSDADLDDLPANTLQQIETNALRATQHQSQVQAQNYNLPVAPESDHGLDGDGGAGDEVVNLDGATSLEDDDESHGPRELKERAPLSQADPTQLLQRIQKLELERARERGEADILKSRLQTKAGETDTLRRRHDADSRRFERQLADQERAHTAEMARLRADMDRLRRDKESAQVDNLFHQHDARDAAMARHTTKPMVARPKASAAARSPAGTPKRPQTMTLPGDGFDDADVVMASPSKPRDRAKAATPKQTGKRKRTATDPSPIQLPALQLSEARGGPTDKNIAPVPAAPASIDAALLQHFRQDDHRFTLLHHLLSHPSSQGSDRILEALTQHAFPSQPAKKLSSIVYDALALVHTPNAHELALQICHIFLDLWKRCQNEKYYAPTCLVLDVLHFILSSEPTETAVQLADRTVPLIIAFIDLVSDPISKAAKGGEKAVTDLFSSAQREVASQIDVMDCLELLYITATSCVSSRDSEAIVRLWQAIPSTFACMLLVKEQPHEQITLMLQILTTSALATSLGPITLADSGLESQASNEDALVNRLTNLFTETPKPISDPSASLTPATVVSEADTWHIRLLVLSVLTHFSISEHGAGRLVQNRLCIGRLIKYLNYSITTLYRHPLSPTQAQKVDSINTAMKLIYRIATSDGHFDIKSKLVNTLGGQHAYLVALTRLAFSEGLVLEAGIEDEVVNMAHDILDEGLSLEEGDAFGKVYSSGNTA